MLTNSGTCEFQAANFCEWNKSRRNVCSKVSISCYNKNQTHHYKKINIDQERFSVCSYRLVDELEEDASEVAEETRLQNRAGGNLTKLLNNHRSDVHQTAQIRNQVERKRTLSEKREKRSVLSIRKREQRVLLGWLYRQC